MTGSARPDEEAPGAAAVATAMRRRRVTRDGVALAVREWPSSGSPIVLVHGLASSSRIFYPLVRRLWPGHHVAAYDQRGHGESHRPSAGYGFDAVGADLGRVISALRLGRPVLVGHSWGANVVLEFAARHPRRAAGVVLVDGGFWSMSQVMDWSTARAQLAPPKFAGMSLDALLTRMRGRSPLGEFWSEDVERAIRSLFEEDERGRIRPRLSRRSHMRILRALWGQPTFDLLAGLRVPALVVAARPAHPTPSEAEFVDMKRRIVPRVSRMPGVRFAWITGVHDLPLQHPARLGRLIEGFAASAAQAGSER